MHDGSLCLSTKDVYKEKSNRVPKTFQNDLDFITEALVQRLLYIN